MIALASSVTTAPDSRRDLKQAGTALLFIAPAMVGFVIFYLRPTLIGFWNSFTDKELLRPDADFVGLENYREMLDDDVFWNALWVTVKYVAINIGIQTVVAIAIAWILDRLSQSRALRTLVLTPWLMSNVVVALLFLWILDFRLGVA
ncbi:MAG: sugar ABC transporter permease, partial [Ilumatobacter sp.]